MKKLLFVLVGLFFFAQVKPAFAHNLCTDGVPCVCEADPCVVIPYRDKGHTINVPAGREVILRWIWASCNYGITLSYTKQVAPGISLNGQSLFLPNEAGQFWNKPVQGAELLNPGECVNNGEYLWWSYWDYPLGALVPGSYRIDYLRIQDHKMIDLYDFNQDGKPDHMEEGDQMGNWVILNAELFE